MLKSNLKNKKKGTKKTAEHLAGLAVFSGKLRRFLRSHIG